MNFIQFLINYWDLILLFVIAIVLVVLAIFKGNKSVVMSMLVSLVTEAEKNFGSGTGTLKMATVIAEIYPKLPTIIKTFITAEKLTKWVEDALIIAKEKWRTNSSIKAYIESENATVLTNIDEAEEPPE